MSSGANFREHPVVWGVGALFTTIVGFAAIWSVFSRDTVPDFLEKRGVVIEWLRVCAILAVTFLALAYVVLARSLYKMSRQPVIAVGQVGQPVTAVPEIGRDRPA